MSDTMQVEEAKTVEITDEEGNVTTKQRPAKFVEVEIAMNYTSRQRETVYSFVNNINTHEGERMPADSGLPSQELLTTWQNR